MYFLIDGNFIVGPERSFELLHYPSPDCTLALTGWVHAKRAVVEPDGLLSARQLAERICASFRCSYEAHLALAEKVS